MTGQAAFGDWSEGDFHENDSYRIIAEHFEAQSRSLAVALVNPTDRFILNLDYIEYRETTISDITIDYDVVIIYGPNAAPLVHYLFRRLRAETPPVMVIAPTVNEDDICAAVTYGATSYLLDDVTRRCMGDLVTRTAYGLMCLDPRAARALVRRIHNPEAPLLEQVVAGDDPPSVGSLSPREAQIMHLIAVGYSVAETAAQLKLKERTIRNNLTSIYAKLHVRRQAEAVLIWLGHQPARLQGCG